MTGHIFIEGEIGSQVTSKTVRADIDNYPQATDFVVHIDSPGGDVYAGYNIRTIIQSLNVPTTAHIGGMCASIATPIAMSCTKVVMNPQGDFMIHLPTATMSGTAEEMRKGAEQLDRIKNELIQIYLPRVSKKGVTSETLSAMMEKETSMSPTEALAMGFVDEVREKLKAVARLDKQIDMTKEQEGWFASIGAKLDALLKKNIKNVDVTMADGSTVTSSAETIDELAGSTLTDEAGQPLPPGQVETAEGLVLTVAEGGLCQSATPKTEANAEPKKEDPKVPSEEEKKMAALVQENEALKAQIAESQKKTEAEAKVVAENQKEFTNKLKELKAELDKVSKQTFGDKTVPQDAPDKTDGKEVDPQIMAMAGSYFQSFKTSR